MRFLSTGLPFALAVGLMLPLAVFAPKGVAPLFAMTVLGAVIARILAYRAFPSVFPQLSLTLAALVVFAATSALWSLTPQRTLEATIPLAGLLFGFVCMAGITRDFDERQRDSIGRVLLVGVFIGLALLLIEVVLSRPLLRWSNDVLGLGRITSKWTLKPAATIAAILFWPTLLVLRKIIPRQSVLWVSGGAFVLAIAPVGGGAAMLGLVFGLLVFLAGLKWSYFTGRVLGGVLTILIMIAPFIPALLPSPQVSMKGIEYLPNSAIHRIYIWQVTAKHINDRPWLGHGLDTARSFYPQSATVQIPLAKQSVGGLTDIYGEPIPLHPHNMILQIWLELGAAGAVLVLAVLLSILHMLIRAPLDRFDKATGFGLFVTASTVAGVSYGAWQAWWLSAMGLCGVMFAVALPRGAASSGKNNLQDITAA